MILVSYLAYLFRPAEKVRKQPEALFQLKFIGILAKVTSKTSCRGLYLPNTLLQTVNFNQCLLHEL